MNEFISQEIISTGDPETIGRFDYILDKIGTFLKKEIRDYFSKNPKGEEVTLEIFKKLGKSKIKDLKKKPKKSKNKDPQEIEEKSDHTIHSDIGKVIAILGYSIYGKKFHTYSEYKNRQQRNQISPCS